MQLPADLPVPEDDRGAAHLPGTELPALALTSTSGRDVRLDQLRGLTLIFAYPRTGRPDQPVPAGWDAIPGARGCTPEACGFRDHHADLRHLEATVFGLSTQDTDYQREMAGRLKLPYEVLSDEQLELTHELRLPSFEFDGATLLKRHTLVLRDARIEHVFYPVFPPDRHAEEVVGWLRQRPLNPPPPRRVGRGRR